MSAVRKGIEGELYVAEWLTRRGWVVGSRRHIKGPGDLLAIHPDDGAVWLIEVKKAKNLWQQFRRADRIAMQEMSLPEGTELWAVNVLPKNELRWEPQCAWP